MRLRCLMRGQCSAVRTLPHARTAPMRRAPAGRPDGAWQTCCSPAPVRPQQPSSHRRGCVSPRPQARTWAWPTTSRPDRVTHCWPRGGHYRTRKLCVFLLPSDDVGAGGAAAGSARDEQRPRRRGRGGGGGGRCGRGAAEERWPCVRRAARRDGQRRRRRREPATTPGAAARAADVGGAAARTRGAARLGKPWRRRGARLSACVCRPHRSSTTRSR